MITARLESSEINSYMRQLYKKSQNLKPFFVHTAIPTIYKSTMLNFRAGGRPDRWKSHSPLTAANRASTVSSHALGQDVLIGNGQLQRSIGTVKKVNKASLEYGTNLIYATLHQYGGTIRPITAKYLTIPLPDAIPGSRARDYENTFIAKGIIFQKRGDDIVPLFLLKKSVKIPARPFMVWQESDLKELARDLLMFIDQPNIYKFMIK